MIIFFIYVLGLEVQRKADTAAAWAECKFRLPVWSYTGIIVCSYPLHDLVSAADERDTSSHTYRTGTHQEAIPGSSSRFMAAAKVANENIEAPNHVSVWPQPRPGIYSFFSASAGLVRMRRKAWRATEATVTSSTTANAPA